MQIFYRKSFLKDFKKLSLSTKNNFYKRQEIFIKNRFDPVLNNHSVGSAFPKCRSINITGDYRAVFKEEKGGVIFILINTHSELYG